MGTGITILLVFIAVVVTLLIAVPVTRKIAVDNKIKQDAEKIGTAEELRNGKPCWRRRRSLFVRRMK